MVSLTNWDSSFFTVELEGLASLNPLYETLSKRVISLNIVEENGALIHGDVIFQEDENCMMSSFLAVGKNLDISWGYKNNNITSIDKMNQLIDNPRQVYATSPARYIKGRVRTASGSGGQDGKQEYKISFVGLMLSNDFKIRNFTKDKIPGLTRQLVVSTIMAEEGLVSIFVKFTSMMELANEYQDGVSNFRFLNQLAIKYNCLFRIGYSSLGVPYALFCDYDDDVTIETFMTNVMGTVGVSLLMSYKKGNANVKSYDWSINAGEGGGDNVRIQYVNQQPVMYRTVATPESTVVYQLNAPKILADMKARGTNPAALTAAVSEMMKLNTMEDLVRRKYFTEISRTTAPQGIGINVNLELIGDPFCTTPARATFGDGFPNIFKIKTLLYYVNKVTHKIDRSGYSCSVNVLDAFQFGLSMLGVR